MTFTSRDFVDWKSNPVTKAVHAHYKERITDVGTELTYDAGKDPGFDRFRAGYIQAIRDLLEVGHDDVREANND